LATEAVAKPTEPPKEGSATRRLWRRISRPFLFVRRLPTSLLVTLVGLALSAWLLPAITRQWDDRQKAHELSASIVSQMATASAAALTAGQDGLFSSSRTTRRAPKEWALTSIQIEARLAAYFPQRVVDHWRAYSEIVDGMLTRLLAPNTFGAALPTAPDARLRAVERQQPFARSVRGIYDVANAQQDYQAQVQANGAVEDSAGLLFDSYHGQERRLLVIEQEIAGEVLHASPTGYSTTFRDFLRDLEP
jgi:hypothetical protein